MSLFCLPDYQEKAINMARIVSTTEGRGYAKFCDANSEQNREGEAIEKGLTMRC